MYSNLTDNKELLKVQIKSLPDSPGVYVFYNNTDKIIYVGKAKNLKKRVSSYFTKQHDNARLKLLIKNISKIETHNVDNELDALILENTLIKKNKPRYNIDLKDDKTYPWICISNERFPRIFTTRQPDNKKNLCFGPYPSIKMKNTVIQLVKHIYPVRTCKLNLSEKNIQRKKFRACLEFHIGNCKSPCENKQNIDEYNENIKNAKEIIKGNLTDVKRNLKKEMSYYSKTLQFEKAQEIKGKIQSLENYQSKSIITHHSLKDCDVITLIKSSEDNYVTNFIRVVAGSVVKFYNFELQTKLDESRQEVFNHALLELKSMFGTLAKEILVSSLPSVEMPGSKYIIPKSGYKKELLVLSEKNARIYSLEKKKIKVSLTESKKSGLLEQVKKDLNLDVLPKHIEAFDVSNFQGKETVAAMVVFKNGKPALSQYRLFNIKTVAGMDDYGSIEEVVERRYKRLLNENADLPQLIVIDGGKGQLQSAAKSLDKLNLLSEIKLISIAKKLETVFAYNDNTPLYLSKTSPVLRLLQHLRNEAHRFGITHHRNKREKTAMQNELNDIKGIGEKTAHKLLLKFGSVKKIKEANFEDIASVIGRAKANILIKYFYKFL